MIPLFDAGEPAEPPGPGSGRREADRCRRCHRPLKDPESLGYHIGPDCRKALGITGRSGRLRARRGRVRGWKPGDEQPGMFDEELNEEETVADTLNIANGMDEPGNGTVLVVRSGDDYRVLIRDDDLAAGDELGDQHWFHAGDYVDDPEGWPEALEYADAVYALGEVLAERGGSS